MNSRTEYLKNRLAQFENELELLNSKKIKSRRDIYLIDMLTRDVKELKKLVSGLKS